jgi:hypothetical protein
MNQETIKILNEFREELLRELNTYCKTISETVNVQMKYEKNHPDEIHACPVSMTYLGQYYGYNGARDVVNEVYDEFLNRPNSHE